MIRNKRLIHILYLLSNFINSYFVLVQVQLPMFLTCFKKNNFWIWIKQYELTSWLYAMQIERIFFKFWWGNFISGRRIRIFFRLRWVSKFFIKIIVQCATSVIWNPSQRRGLQSHTRNATSNNSTSSTQCFSIQRQLKFHNRSKSITFPNCYNWVMQISFSTPKKMCTYIDILGSSTARLFLFLFSHSKS